MYSSLRRAFVSPGFRSACALGASGALVGFSGSVATSDQGQEGAWGPREPAPKHPLRPWDQDREFRRPGAPPVPGEPTYTRAQVAANDGVDGRPFWVSYRGGVYDVTEFHKIHPGGHIISQSAGADVSPFWNHWAVHHYSPHVGPYLEKIRIGALEEEHDPYEAEPVRDKAKQTVFMQRPYCSEAPNKVLVSSYLTSPAALYVRNHAPVPDCGFAPEGENWASNALKHEVVFEAVSCGIDGSSGNGDGDNNDNDNDNDKPSPSFTVRELEERFGTATITSILQCAGNRATEDIKATGESGFKGIPLERITQGMLGNVQWSGVRLADVLPALYPLECAASKRHGGGEWHVIFVGAEGYSASTPLARILDRKNDCLLATSMNGKPLTPDHGYPVRALLPGVAGARNVKWLDSISLSRKPVDAPWNAYYYRNAKLEQIQGLPLQSLILEVKHKRASSQSLQFEVSGVAYSGGTGNAIARVEVSKDGGKNWTEAKLKTEEVIPDDSSKNFGWVRWVAQVEVEKGLGKTVVCCRAFDTEGKTQIETTPKERGYIYSGWSKVEVGS